MNNNQLMFAGIVMFGIILSIANLYIHLKDSNKKINRAQFESHRAMRLEYTQYLCDQLKEELLLDKWKFKDGPKE